MDYDTKGGHAGGECHRIEMVRESGGRYSQRGQQQ